jgi:hypothetical protein
LLPAVRAEFVEAFFLRLHDSGRAMAPPAPHAASRREG